MKTTAIFRKSVHALFALVLGLSVLAPVSSLAQRTLAVPAVSGDQLIFFYDARTDRVTFISIANPASEPVSLEVDFYSPNLNRRLAREAITLEGASNTVVDPTLVDGISGRHGLVVVTPVNGSGLPVVPPAELIGGFTLANTRLGAGFGQSPMGRNAVNRDGEPSPVGTVVNGTNHAYQRFTPAVLGIPVYFRPDTLEPAENDGNRIILASFNDNYSGGFSISGRASNPVAAFFDNSGAEVAVSDISFTGTFLGDLEGIAGAGLNSSGKAFFDVQPGDGNSFGLFSQSLQTYAAGQRMAAVAEIPIGNEPADLVNCDSGSVMVSSNITANQTWPANCAIYLDGTIFVEAGVVLSIQPGATIFGMKNPNNPPPSALIFRQDSKINANGTATQPIVFTSDQPVGRRVPGDWAGLALNGRAPVNCPEGQCTAEGLENTFFGGNRPEDDSGTARYLRIEFAGQELAPDNELNVFTMNAIGSGSTIDHIHAHMGLDDGIEWFGGTVKTSHMISTGAADDLFDWQIGYTGALQYGYGKQYDGNIDEDGSRGFEGDNNENGFGLAPRSDARFCNVTLIGTKDQPGDTNNRAMVLRRGTEFRIGQTLSWNWAKAGFEMRDTDTKNVACNADGSPTGASYLAGSLFFQIGDGPEDICSDRTSEGANCESCEFIASLDAAGYDVTWGNPELDPGCASSGFDCNPVPPSSAPAIASDFACSSIDPDFEDNNYIGAFQPGAPSWAVAPWAQYPVN